MGTDYKGVLADPFVEAQGRSSQVIKWTLAAGATKSFPAFGQMFYVKELYASAPLGAAVADVLIKTGFSADNPFNVGTGEGFGTLFDVIEVRNPGSLPVYFEIYVGFSSLVGFIDNRLNVVRIRPESVQPVMDAAAFAVGWPGVPAGTYSIPASTGRTFDGVPPTGGLQRKSITVSNLDTTLTLQIRDADGEVIGVIFPETAQVYFISGEVEVYNPDATNPVDCFIGEIFYENPAP